MAQTHDWAISEINIMRAPTQMQICNHTCCRHFVQQFQSFLLCPYPPTHLHSTPIYCKYNGWLALQESSVLVPDSSAFKPIDLIHFSTAAPPNIHLASQSLLFLSAFEELLIQYVVITNRVEMWCISSEFRLRIISFLSIFTRVLFQILGSHSIIQLLPILIVLPLTKAVAD